MNGVPPVALFVYRRPDHAQRTIQALARCPEAGETRLVVFSDGFRGPGDAKAVEETRAVVRAARGFRDIRIVERARNVGLFQNIVSGLNELFSENDSAVVLEDDIEVGSDFLSFMSAALDYYAARQTVFSVTGFLYPADFHFPQSLDSFLFPRFCCWGWATWKDRWHKVDWRIPSLASFMGSRDVFRRFWNVSNDLPEIMLDLIQKKNNSWSILFNYWQMIHRGYCAYPTRSHAVNIGFDGSGTHAGRKDKFRIPGNLTTAAIRTRDLHFADAYDESLSEPLRIYFRNGVKRRIKNLLRYGRLF